MIWCKAKVIMKISRYPKVSVICLSYNHAKYITNALDGFLMQKTDFAFEVIIHDDKSTDGTAEIIRDYQEKYPDIIKPIFENENLYSKGNFEFINNLFVHSKANYIAVCEGDDYWTDPSKLQRQVDFMDRHPDYAICFHPVDILVEDDDRESREVYPSDKGPFTIERLLSSNFIQTNSVMYRKPKYQDLSTYAMPGDWYLHLYHAQFGRIGFIDRVMSVYRKHSGGVWAGVRDNQEEFWNKHGLGHLLFHKIIYDLPGFNEQQRVIILRNITYTMMEMLEHSNIAHTDLEGFVKLNPDTTTKVIVSLLKEQENLRAKVHKQANQIGEKNDTINELVKQLNDIKSSKVWKFRNKLVSLKGKTG